MLAYQDGNLRRLFNTSGIEYRGLGLAAKLPDDGPGRSAAPALHQRPARQTPFVLGDSFGLVGFDPAAWSKVFR